MSNCEKKLTVLVPVDSTGLVIECLIVDQLKVDSENPIRANRLLKEFQEMNEKVDTFHIQSEFDPKGFVTKVIQLFPWAQYQPDFICLFEVPSTQITYLKELLNEDEKGLSRWRN